jgi:hypothetical protein
VPYLFKSLPGSSLPLFVPFVAANNANDTLAPDDFAVFAEFFD